MKYVIIYFVCFILFEVSYAQKYMTIVQKQGITTRVLLEDVDSVCFEYDKSIDVNQNDSGIDTLFNPTFETSFEYPNSTGYEDMCFSGDTLYAVGNFGLRVFDCSIPDEIKLLKEMSLSDTPMLKGRSIAQTDDYLYIGMRQNTGGVNELYSPKIKVDFETNLMSFYDSSRISNNEKFNKFFKTLKIKSVDSSKITKVWIYRCVYDDGLYKNVIRFTTDDDESVIFCRNVSPILSEAQNLLCSSYSTAEGDFCEVDWDLWDSELNYLQNIVLYNVSGSYMISDNEILNKFFKSLHIQSVPISQIKKLYIYKGVKINNVYRVVLRFDTPNSSCLFDRSDFESYNDAINSLKSEYVNEMGDRCVVDWDVITSEANMFTDFTLHINGIFDTYNQSANISVSESGDACPNLGQHSLSISTANEIKNVEETTLNLMLSSPNLSDISIWINNITPASDKSYISLYEDEYGKRVYLVLFPFQFYYKIGVKIGSSEVLLPTQFSYNEWIQYRIKHAHDGVHIYNRSRMSEAWAELASVLENVGEIKKIILGAKTSANNLNVLIDNIYIDSELELNSYVNGKFVIVNKANLEIENTYNLDLKCTGIATNGKVLVLDFLKGCNMYSLENPIKPVLKYTERPSYFKEYQNCTFFSNNGHEYAFVCNYGLGYTIYDVTNSDSIFVVAKDENWMCNYNGYEIGEAAYNFDVVVKYPKAYLTKSTLRPYLNTNFDERGLIVLDISNFDNIVSKFVPVPRKYMTEIVEGDPRPTRMELVRNKIVLNNTDKGFLVFDVSDSENPVFERSVRIPGAKSINTIKKDCNDNIYLGEDMTNPGPKVLYKYKLYQ